MADVVSLWVSTQARASARERTLWNLGGAHDGRGNRRAPARTDVGLERDVGAFGTLAFMAEELALVFAARERLTADERADVSAHGVVGVVARGTADGLAAVDAARLHLAAHFIAEPLRLSARDKLLGRAATTLAQDKFVTRLARPVVTLFFATMHTARQ